MTTTTRRSWRRIAGVALVPVAAVALGACLPQPPPPPPPPPPPTVTCSTPTTGAAAPASDWVEQCHLRYKSYALDTTNTSAQATADRLAQSITQTQCTTALATLHTPSATLMSLYPGSSSVGENLYCLFFSPPGCAGGQFGATKAMNSWLASPGHKANLDNFAGKSVNAAAACIPATASPAGPSIYVAVAQFHNP